MNSAVQDIDVLVQQFVATRHSSIENCKSLEIEDYGLQAAVFASPPKWHLAHTSWFFETFILKPFCEGYEVFHPAYEVLFNSYYHGIGAQYPRHQRGLLSRPTVAEVLQYRRHVDDRMQQLLSEEQHPQFEQIVARCKLGMQHEKQHQELFFTDLKYSFSQNPLFPAYSSDPINDDSPFVEQTWVPFKGGLVDIGVNQNSRCFSFDNETPRHKHFLESFELANRLVTNAEYQQFVNDGGYQRPELWLADGWAIVQEQNWQRPLYWYDNNQHFTLYGLQERADNNPVCHLSAYEADAYAKWAGARLPTEFEWEHAAKQSLIIGSTGFYQDARQALHFEAAKNITGIQQLHSHVWQWTASAYRPYPGMQTESGAIGEYNGKFMSNQWVLRGGSCVSPAQHLRPSYRNFFYPQDRWQFSGLRLAR